MSMSKSLKASLVRCSYMMHGIAGVFILVFFTNASIYWAISSGVILIMIEVLLTFKIADGGEWKWFIPSVLAYLCIAVPVIWITELFLLDIRVNARDRLNITNVCPVNFYAINDLEAHCIVSGADKPFAIDAIEVERYNFGIAFSAVYQQTLMLVLILGRWVMPKGGMTRDELSMLLLVFIGLAADMLEFSLETLKLESIACNQTVYMVILGIWSWSLLQYTLGLTATKKRPRRKGGLSVNKEPPSKSSSSASDNNSCAEEETGCSHSCLCADIICGTEIWALVTDIVLQDGPYFCMRVYLIVTFHIFDQSMLFFTCKNALLLALQLNRFVSVIIASYKEYKRRRREERRDEERLAMERRSASPVPIHEGRI